MAPIQQPPLSADTNRYLSKCHPNIDVYVDMPLLTEFFVVDADRPKTKALEHGFAPAERTRQSVNRT